MQINEKVQIRKFNIFCVLHVSKSNRWKEFILPWRQKMSEGIFKIKCSNCRKMCVNMLLWQQQEATDERVEINLKYLCYLYSNTTNVSNILFTGTEPIDIPWIKQSDAFLETLVVLKLREFWLTYNVYKDNYAYLQWLISSRPALWAAEIRLKIKNFCWPIEVTYLSTVQLSSWAIFNV